MKDGMKTMTELKKWPNKHTDAEGWNARLIGFTWQASTPDATGYVEEKWFWTPPPNDKDKGQTQGRKKGQAQDRKRKQGN